MQQGRLPGERFDAHEQCMLKYGKGSIHAISQDLSEVCRDLHCQRDRYTWTSHPALEGTLCGPNKVRLYDLNIYISQHNFFYLKNEQKLFLLKKKKKLKIFCTNK